MATMSEATPPRVGGQNSFASASFAAVGRVLLAVNFLVSGYDKLTDTASALSYMRSVNLPLPMVGLVLAIGIQLIGGGALALGLQAQRVAIVLALYSLATATIFHGDFADQNQLLHFLKNLAIVGGLLQIVAYGPGPLSLPRFHKSTAP